MREEKFNGIQTELLRYGYPVTIVRRYDFKSDFFKAEVKQRWEDRREKRLGDKR